MDMNIDLNSLAAYGPNILTICFIIAVGVSVNLTISRALSYLLRQEYIAEPIYTVGKNITRWIIFIIVVLFTLQQVGIKVSSSLALTDTSSGTASSTRPSFPTSVTSFVRSSGWTRDRPRVWNSARTLGWRVNSSQVRGGSRSCHSGSRGKWVQPNISGPVNR